MKIEKFNEYKIFEKAEAISNDVKKKVSDKKKELEEAKVELGTIEKAIAKVCSKSICQKVISVYNLAALNIDQVAALIAVLTM